jgi:hypothetical protein
VRTLPAARWICTLGLGLFAVIGLAGAVPPARLPAAEALALGASIYNEGRLPSGAPITGRRDERAPVFGAAAACTNCHRPSGLGQVEGDAYVPPIASRFLFAPRGSQGVLTMDPRVSKSFNRAHDPYTEPLFIRAIRDGVNSEGRPMSVLMPRYDLDEPTLAALAAYLRQLSTDWSPGVTATQISLATVITPEVDAPRRKAFIAMMQAIARLKNANTAVADQKKNRHHMVTAAEMVLGTERTWDLQIWELQGPPESWGAQLAEHYRDHPVFAVVSGLSDASWQPVQDFCEHQRVPCWFPSVSASASDPGNYTIYFSAGVRLEAALLARQFTAGSAQQARRGRRLVQVYREGEPGSTAALALRAALAGSGVDLVESVIPSQSPAAGGLREALRAAKEQDTLVFWLRTVDLQALDALDAPRGETYFSGSLAQGEAAPIPQGWREHAHIIYPYQLPQLRGRNLDYLHAWLNLHHIPLIDEAMQSEVFFAMNYLTDTLAEMLDNLYRDYLIERAEEMLSKRESNKAEQEIRDSKALGREGDLLQRRGPMTMDESVRLKPLTSMSGMPMNTGTTVYAHLSLGVGQRFASKSGYIVHFAGTGGSELTAETSLLVP